MKRLLLVAAIFIAGITHAQCPGAPGDEVSYGTNDVWIGYVYDNINLTNYMGYMNEGTSGNPSFDQNFGGDYSTFTINGCATYAETFSVRYKLQKTFADGDYQFTAGGDDGFRLSLDGGITWVINRWNDQSYTFDSYVTHLNGTYNLVLEFYENGGNNRVSFAVEPACIGTENTAVYGTNNVWRGYVYDGINFGMYKGMVTAGSSTSYNFDQNFGGDYVNYNTSTCGVYTETFSVRYRLQQTLPNDNYLITVGADDGFRLSLDGGATWVINQWSDHGYYVSSVSLTLSGTYNMVLEFYENGGGNRVSFLMTGSSTGVLPIQLLEFKGRIANNGILLNWKTSSQSNTDHFEIQRGTDGNAFNTIGRVNAMQTTISNTINYSFTDSFPLSGASVYRLVMIDQTGHNTYSPVLRFNRGIAGKIKIFPTVLNRHERLFIQSSTNLKNVLVSVTDMSGRQINAINITSLSANEIREISLGNKIATGGTYFVKIAAGQDILEKRLIVIQ